MVLALAGTACGTPARARDDGNLSVVAAIYPLAALAEGVGVPVRDVVDLTPPGGEAHDAILSPSQRESLQTADLVLYLGHFGFQPEVEAVADQGDGRAVAVATGLGVDVRHDPHVWLDPVLAARMVPPIAAALERIDPPGASGYRARTRTLTHALLRIAAGYRRTLGRCRYDTMLVSHEAFGYLASRFGLQQVGFSSVNPEGEPTPQHLEDAAAALTAGRAGAVFYESRGEDASVARAFAAEHGVPALPLSTMETEPEEGLLGAFAANLHSLRRGLECR
jgi:zinc transport system substrate-binding protein